MINNPTWAGIREAYANSFATLKSLPCDVFLGPHAPFFDMEAKVPKMLSVSPILLSTQQGISDISRWEELPRTSREGGLRANEIVPSGSGMKFDLNG